MKFNLTDVPKMGLAALVTAIIFYFTFLYERTPPIQKSDHERISWDEAERLKLAYLNSQSIVMVTYINSVTKRKVEEPLHGFKMDARHIDEIINKNKNAVGRYKKADTMMIYFGYGSSGKAGDTINNLQIIVAGMQNGKIMRNAVGTNIDDSSVFDRADPCPPNTVP